MMTNYKLGRFLLPGVIASLSLAPEIGAAAFDPVSYEAPRPTIRLSVTGSFRGGIFSRRSPSTPGYDPLTGLLLIPSEVRQGIDVVNITDPYLPKKVGEIDLTQYGGEPSSLAIYKGVVAVVVQDMTGKTTDSNLLFMTVQGKLLIPPILLPSASRAQFTPNGRRLVVSLPGGANDEYTVDPEGGIAVIDLGRVRWGLCRWGHRRCRLSPRVRIADFSAYNDRKQELIDKGVRIYGPNATVAQDLEPAGFGITRDSRLVYVVLQPNNAIAVVDLRRARVTDIFALGWRDNNLPGNGIDASDKDEAINIRNWPVRSFFMPDGAAVIKANNSTYILTANEGDLRDEEGFSEKAQVRDLVLDSKAYPDASLSAREGEPRSVGGHDGQR